MAIKNKTAISLMLSYVLLVVMAIALSVGVYSWLKFYATGAEPIEKCPEDVSLIIQDYTLLADKQIELSIKNKGLFNISGYYIKGTDNKTQESWFSLKDIMGVGISGAVEGTYLFSEPFPPNAESTNTFSYEGLEKLEKIEIEPFRIQEKTSTKKKNIILCDSAVITQEIIEYGCDFYHLKNCDETNCSAAGGFWWNFECHSTPAPVDPFNPIFLESLVSWWKFNEDDGSLVFDFKDGNTGNIYGDTRLLMHFDEGSGNPQDNSSYDNDGVITGATWAGIGNGKSGNALSFDGINDYINVSDSASLRFTSGSNVSIEFWAKLNDDAGWIMHNYDGVNNYWQIELRGDGRIWSQWRTSVANYLRVGSTTDLTSVVGWHHIVLIYNGSAKNASIHVDGVIQNSSMNTALSGNFYNSNKIQIGRSASELINGTIDEVAIYSKALSQSEITEHFNAGRAKFIERIPGKSGSGNALSFDGVDDYAEANVADIKNTTVFWYKNSTATSWTFVANSSGTLYVNGILGTPSQYPIYISGNVVQIGKTGASTFFSGAIDEVMVFNQALSQENITSIYQYYTS